MRSKIAAFFGNTVDKRGLLPSTFFALLAAIRFAPHTAELDTFDRVIGISVIEGVDVSARMLRFFSWYLIIIPIAFLAGCLLTGFIIKLYEKNAGEKELSECLSFIRSLSVVGIAAEAMTLTNLFYLSENDGLILVLKILTFAFGAVFVYGVTCKFNGISFGAFKLSLFITFTLYVSSSIFTDGRKSMYISAAVFAAVFIAFLLSGFVHKRDRLIAFSKRGLILLSFFPAAAALFSELTNILNQYNVFVSRKKIVLAGIFAAFVIAAALVAVLRRKSGSEVKWERAVYPALIVGVLLIANLPSLQTVVNTDLFEQANHGMLTYDLFAYGKIPVIESFDGHMLRSSWTGIIYGLLNQDTVGASFVPYLGLNNVVFAIIGYCILSRFFDKDFALLAVLFIPYPLNVSFGVISVLALMRASEKNTFTGWLLFWLSLVAVTLYEFPQGVSFGVGTFVTVIILFVFSKTKFSAKNVLLSLAVTLSAFAALFFGICLIKGIPAFDRIKEFLSLLASNTNWAYSTMGSPYLFAYALIYVLMPITMLGVFIYSVYKLRNADGGKIHSLCVAEIALAAAYFANFSRALGRHCVAEMHIALCLWTAPLALALFFAIAKPRIKLSAFTAVTASVAIVSLLLVVNKNYKNEAPAAVAANRIKGGIFAADTDSKVQRVVLSDEMKEKTEYITDAINLLMTEEGETYIDFTGQTLLYALSGKEKPVYVNQSPQHLSGEYTQEAFIKEANEKNCVFALVNLNTDLPYYKLDGILNGYRYYKVSEYIWGNYTPVAAAGDYAFLCRNDKLGELSGRIEKAIISGKLLCLNKYDFSPELRDYKLGELPYLWGNHDVKKAYLNPIVSSSAGRLLNVDATFDRSKGNYIMIDIHALRDTSVTTAVYVPNRGEVCRFTFNVKKGDATYLLRVSADMSWYYEDSLAIQTAPTDNSEEDDAVITVNSQSILKGD